MYTVQYGTRERGPSSSSSIDNPPPSSPLFNVAQNAEGRVNERPSTLGRSGERKKEIWDAHVAQYVYVYVRPLVSFTDGHDMYRYDLHSTSPSPPPPPSPPPLCSLISRVGTTWRRHRCEPRGCIYVARVRDIPLIGRIVYVGFHRYLTDLCCAVDAYLALSSG